MTPQPAPFRSFGRRATLKEMHITPMNPKANPPTVSASQSHSRLLAHLMALMVSAIWATTFVCSKELLAYYSPAQVMFMRFVIAYFVLWLLRPRPLPWQSRGELTFLLLGILGGTLYFFTENTALKHTFAANVSIIVAMAPILTSILAHFFTRDEKLHTTVWVGFAVAMSGVVLVVLNGALVLKLSPVGDLLAFLAAASWACYSVLIKRLSGRVDSTLLARRVILYGAVTSVPLLPAGSFRSTLPRWHSQSRCSASCSWRCWAVPSALPCGMLSSTGWESFTPITISISSPLSL